jgi:hypothetical protein
MLTFKKFTRIKHTVLEESNISTKQMETHLSHIEDLAIEQGKAGFSEFVLVVDEFIKKIQGLDSTVDINAKIDGAPALLFGFDPRNDQFFISTKHVVDPMLSLIPPDAALLHSEQEIDMFYGDRPEFAEKLKTLFRELNRAYDKSGLIYQCDVLYAGDQDKQKTVVDGESYTVFKPNVIAYAIPDDVSSPLYHEVNNSQVGIAAHDSFRPKLVSQKNVLGSLKRAAKAKDKKQGVVYNKKIESLSQKTGEFVKLFHYGRNMKRLVASAKSANVFVMGSNFTQANVNVDPTVVSRILELIESGKGMVDSITPEFDSAYVNSQVMEYLKIYINSQVDLPGGGIFGKATFTPQDVQKFIAGFKKFIENRYNVKINKLKQERAIRTNQQKLLELVNFIEQNVDSVSALVSLFGVMIQIKKLLLPTVERLTHSLSKVFFQDPDGTMIPTKGEGHVLFNGDTHVKIVDRLEFTKVNRARGGQR